MNVTIKDVAKYANVSPSTVSRVLQDSPRISQATKDKVNEAMTILGYYPNAIAQSLANKSSHTLGLILPSSVKDAFVNPFFIQFIRGVSRYTQRRNYSLILSSARNEEDEYDHVLRLVHSKRVDGIILLTVRENDRNVEYLQKSNFPFAVVGSPEDKDEILWVDNDNNKAMYEVVDKLILSGHKNIAFLGGSKRLEVTKNRLEGYLGALKKNNLDANPDFIIEGNFSEEEGYRGTKKLLQNHRNVDAIVTTDDMIAFGSMKAIQELGYKIPDDISVVGFNNTQIARFSSPTLSSVEINSSKLGIFAAKLVIDKITLGDIEKNHYVIKTRLVNRNSTK